MCPSLAANMYPGLLPWNARAAMYGVGVCDGAAGTAGTNTCTFEPGPAPGGHTKTCFRLFKTAANCWPG